MGQYSSYLYGAFALQPKIHNENSTSSASQTVQGYPPAQVIHPTSIHPPPFPQPRARPISGSDVATRTIATPHNGK